jgi:hypothetical protein
MLASCEELKSLEETYTLVFENTKEGSLEVTYKLRWQVYVKYSAGEIFL